MYTLIVIIITLGSSNSSSRIATSSTSFTTTFSSKEKCEQAKKLAFLQKGARAHGKGTYNTEINAYCVEY